jgi:predicted O-linked N-acetylglucosamine transferase (SPINDLY family)
VDRSVLWLLEDNATAVANLRGEAQARGVDPSRLVFAARQSPEEHLARQSLAGLFLDTLPCNAHTTASDALWAGLPVLTVAGSSFAGRVAASLLSAVGMPELVAPSLESYEAMALTLARDTAGLEQLKAKLAKNRETSPLFDTARFTRHLEDAFTGIWERHQRGESPVPFAVVHRE